MTHRSFLPHGVEKEHAHGLRHGGTRGRVSGLGGRGGLHRVDPQLGGQVAEDGGLFGAQRGHLGDRSTCGELIEVGEANEEDLLCKYLIA